MHTATRICVGLQVVELASEGLLNGAGLAVDGGAVRGEVRVVGRGRHRHRAGAPLVQVAHAVGELLHVVGTETRGEGRRGMVGHYWDLM